MKYILRLRNSSNQLKHAATASTSLSLPVGLVPNSIYRFLLATLVLSFRRQVENLLLN
jgi:hypothetical protein